MSSPMMTDAEMAQAKQIDRAYHLVRDNRRKIDPRTKYAVLEFISGLFETGTTGTERDRDTLQVLGQIKDILERNKYRRMSAERFREYDAILERLLAAAKQEKARTRRRTRLISGSQGVIARPRPLKALDITLDHRSFGYLKRDDSIINSHYQEPVPWYFPLYMVVLSEDDGRDDFKLVIPKGTRMYHGHWSINPRDYMKDDRLFVGLFPAISMAILTETLAFYNFEHTYGIPYLVTLECTKDLVLYNLSADPRTGLCDAWLDAGSLPPGIDGGINRILIPYFLKNDPLDERCSTYGFELCFFNNYRRFLAFQYATIVNVDKMVTTCRYPIKEYLLDTVV